MLKWDEFFIWKKLFFSLVLPTFAFAFEFDKYDEMLMWVSQCDKFDFHWDSFGFFFGLKCFSFRTNFGMILKCTDIESVCFDYEVKLWKFDVGKYPEYLKM
jgi:hypothetical protein